MRTLLVALLAFAALSARASQPETPQPATPAKGQLLHRTRSTTDRLANVFLEAISDEAENIEQGALAGAVRANQHVKAPEAQADVAQGSVVPDVQACNHAT